LRQSLKTTIQSIDRMLFRLCLGLFEEKSCLLTFLFHEVYADQKEIQINHKHPHQRMTLEHFRRFIDYYLENGFKFVGPGDIPSNLSAGQKYILVTFDDGYFNNLLILPMLKEYRIPAVVFVSTNHVKEGKCFWWDVVYRERTKRGVSDAVIEAEIEMLKSKKHDEIETYVVSEFGSQSLTPLGDIDRPMTEKELRDFAAQDRVAIGNHTSDHAVLTNYSVDEVDRMVRDAQRYLERVTGKPPESISYPNGNYTEEVIEICRQNGLRIGITVESKKNYLPLEEGYGLFRLGRFILHGNDRIEEQCEFFRSDIALYNRLKRLLGRGIGEQ
jgi:peptidoglycan/xylan/chitin deacetylase (PgdA/CDA1 family)